MTSCRTMDDLWTTTVRELLTNGHEIESRVGMTKELLGYGVTLSNVNQTFLLNRRRKLSPTYACAEFLWYLSLSNNIKMIKAYAPQYEKFAENDVAFGAYGDRILNNVKGAKNQIELLVEHLRQNFESRQAIITLWNADDLRHAILKDHKDLPCTLSLQFLIRNDELHMVTTMRSNDAWLGLPYDVFAFTCLQWLVASFLSIPPGTYTHQVGSMHLYKKNWSAAREALQLKFQPPEHLRLEHRWNQVTPELNQEWDDIYRATLCEQEYREGRHVGTHPVNETLYDAVKCCATKWGATRPIEWYKIKSPIILEALKNVQG